MKLQKHMRIRALISAIAAAMAVQMLSALIASGDADETFIVGEEVPADAADRNSSGNGAGGHALRLPERQRGGLRFLRTANGNADNLPLRS